MAEPYDFRSIVMICNVFAPDTGETASFSINAPSGVDAHLPYLSRMTVKETISGFNEVEISLAPPTYEKALSLLESPWLTIGNTMSVRWGYARHSSHITPWHHTFMLKPNISFGDEFGITLKGVSFGWMASRFATKQVWSQVDVRKGDTSKPQMMRKEIIEAIAKRYNFTLFWNGKPGFDLEKWPPEILDVWTEVKNFIQGGQNDLLYMKYLAADAGCRVIILRGNELHINSVSYYKDPDYRLVYRGQVDLANNVFPIDTFDSDSTPLFLPRTGINPQLMNPNSPKSKLFKKYKANEQTTKDPTYSGDKVPADDPQSPKTKGPDGRYLPHRQRSPEGGPPYFPVTPNKDLLEQKIQNMYRVKNADASDHGISATCSGPDLPMLLPESIVKVDGVGRYFSVMYRVHTVTHTVGSEFARMQVELKPKGFPGGMAKWMSVEAPKPKTYDPGRAQPSTGNSPTMTDARPGSEFEPSGGGVI